MEKLNSYLSALVSTITIIGFVGGFFLYFYKNALDEVSELKAELKAQNRSIIDIEKGMLKATDSHLVAQLKSMDMRMAAIEDFGLGKSKELRKLVDEFRTATVKAPEREPIRDHVGRIIDLDREKYSGALESRVEALEKSDLEFKRILANLRKVVTSHNEYVKAAKEKERA